ncbi:MAG: hypothetical protein K9G67_04865 [Bacteroidales bacterium]|nr:hypothetical protein [Bacteroidales bacterium]MCF8343457.1 hypothetical protein [Bacteroidales bacterium]MCF8375663.1 hypothetical protein [Bacteroidales bacterium]MCF8401461.1 hypothetical protein [Bacteroidales bacterium]
MLDIEKTKHVFDSFNKRRVLILGDVMVDSYVWGHVERISPEAPVPIVAVNKRENRLGGAANVALNIRSLGAEPVLCSVIGQDLKGEEFLSICQRENLPVHGLLQSDERITTTKFRIIGNKAQLLRVDEEFTEDLTEREANDFYVKIEKILKEENIDAVIFQDYNKGVLTSGIIHKTIKLANELKVPIVVDPKKKNFDAFQDVTLFKPNLKELKEGLKRDFDAGNKTALSNAVQYLHNRQKVKMVLTTLSDAGVFYSRMNSETDYESGQLLAHHRSIADVSGAGDTVVSVATLCLVAGLKAEEIAAISNLAGGIVCEKVGVVPVSKERLLEETLKHFG